MLQRIIFVLHSRCQFWLNRIIDTSSWHLIIRGHSTANLYVCLLTFCPPRLRKLIRSKPHCMVTRCVNHGIMQTLRCFVRLELHEMSATKKFGVSALAELPLFFLNSKVTRISRIHLRILVWGHQSGEARYRYLMKEPFFDSLCYSKAITMSFVRYALHWSFLVGESRAISVRCTFYILCYRNFSKIVGSVRRTSRPFYLWHQSVLKC